MHIVSRSMRASPSMRSHLTTLLILLVLFAALTFYTFAINTHVEFDERLSRFILNFRQPAMDKVALAVTMMADLYLSIVLIVMLTVALIVERRWWPACYVLCTFFSASLSVTIIKVLTQRPRPALTDATVALMSFPSGHATRAVFVFGIMALLLSYGRSSKARRIALSIAALGSLLIVVSRVYLGVHWPSDVIAGAILGAVVLTVVDWLFAFHQERNTTLSLSPLSVVGVALLAYLGYTLYGVDDQLILYGLSRG